MVEFALVLPFFLALTFGVVDLGMGLYANNTIAGVSRAGARYLALNPSATNQQLFAAATYGIAGISTDPAVLTVVADPADPSLRLTGTRVAVAVTYDFRPVVPLGRLVNLLAGSGGGAAPGDQFTLTSAAASFVE